MAAIRNLSRIIIRVDTTTGLVIDVEAETRMSVRENGIALSGVKVYAKDYADLGAGGRARLDSMVADANSFIEAQEPRGS